MLPEPSMKRAALLASLVIHSAARLTSQLTAKVLTCSTGVLSKVLRMVNKLGTKIARMARAISSPGKLRPCCPLGL